MLQAFLALLPLRFLQHPHPTDEERGLNLPPRTQARPLTLEGEGGGWGLVRAVRAGAGSSIHWAAGGGAAEGWG